MNKIRIFQLLAPYRRTIHLSMVPLLLLLVAGIYVLVYKTGGIKFVYSHSMYLPILLAGLVFGMRGGVLMALLGGITLGPFMPIDVATGEMQKMSNWLYRTGFFILVGFLSGVASDSVRSYLRHLQWVSRHDASTQLPNRHGLLDALGTLAKEKYEKDAWILIVVSLENVMELKSAFGFDIVEEIIRQSAVRFKCILQHKTAVYRTSSEQIGILIRHRGVDNTDALLAALIEGYQQPFLFKDIPVHADTRIGHVSISQFDKTPEQYLQQAELALVAAHKKGQDCLGYSPRISIDVRENLSNLGELMHAIKGRQLALHYQPKIAIHTGDIHSAEALMRWRHPERGIIYPGAFIPSAEQSTLIHSITEFALEQAMEQIVRWRQCGIHIPIAVNISPRNLLQPGFSELVLQLLQDYGLGGESLELEVTEGALMMDMDRTSAELGRLADANIAISIDDFGTGYSSLQYLHQLPISLIKIDQSFVRRLPADDSAVHIVEAAVTLAHKMGMKTIAEGVETREVYDLLGNLGCDIAQGFVISPALPANEFEQWHREREGRFSWLRA